MPVKIGEINEKISIAGNGIVALMIAYLLFLRAKEENKPLKMTVRGKYRINETTAAFLVPSLSWNELLSVVPPGSKLLEALKKLFTEFNGGIRLEPSDDILVRAKEFINAVEACGKSEAVQRRRTELLVEFSKLSLSIWELIYATADDELRKIFIESNFLPCRELSTNDIQLRDGYRLDVYYQAKDLEKKVQTAVEESAANGYNHARHIPPGMLLKLDPAFQPFCQQYSSVNVNGVREWHEGAGVIFRPGGCINTPIFLTRFCDYLQQAMGKYVTETGEEKFCFKSKLGEVTGLSYSANANHVTSFEVDHQSKKHKRDYSKEYFILSPGERIGTVRRLGLFEPPHARFVGFSLKLTIPKSMVEQCGYSMDYKSNMAIRTGEASSSVVQVLKNEQGLVLGIGGLKAFLGLDDPDLQADYAIQASVYQLNMLNQVYASLISACLKRDTQGKQLTINDLQILLNSGMLQRAVGSRACAYDGAPTIDYGRNGKGPVENLIVATHLSSGGVTNATGTAFMVDGLLRQGQSTSQASVSSIGKFNQVKAPAHLGDIYKMTNSLR